jgi:hypothetical protein
MGSTVLKMHSSFRVDLGTSDYLGLDVLLNCLTQLSSE